MTTNIGKFKNPSEAEVLAYRKEAEGKIITFLPKCEEFIFIGRKTNGVLVSQGICYENNAERLLETMLVEIRAGFLKRNN